MIEIRNPRGYLSVLAGLVFSSAVLAQSARLEEMLSRLAPPEREAYVEQLVARQQAERLQTIRSDATADVTPPVLTMFNANPTLNVSKAAAPFKIVFKATDDLSGVLSITANALGPSGQSVAVNLRPGYPAKNVGGKGGFSPLNRLLEPGTWKFSQAYGYDVAGNFFSVSSGALAALGNTTFTVVNNSGYDLVKPSLTGGQLQTPSVSISSHVPGTTDTDRYVGVKLNLTDAGNTAVAGVASAYAKLCQVGDPNKCLSLSGLTSATGQPSVTLSATAQVSAARGNVPGDYELQSVYVYDQAGNYASYLGTKFGGTTDFGAMFPATKIMLSP
jgi:hypothetical protein